MIEIKAWHGQLDRKHIRHCAILASRLDEIAKPSLIHPDTVWSFEGTVADFATKYKDNFMVLWQDAKPKIFITQYNSFGTR